MVLTRGPPETFVNYHTRGARAQAYNELCGRARVNTEVISTYSRCSEKVYMCFYDLQKAFDSITIHTRAWSSSRLCPLPSVLPADNGPSLEIPTE